MLISAAVALKPVVPTIETPPKARGSFHESYARAVKHLREGHTSTESVLTWKYASFAVQIYLRTKYSTALNTARLFDIGGVYLNTLVL